MYIHIANGKSLIQSALIRNLSMNGSFHSHGGTPSSLDDFIENTIHKWMMTQVIPISGNLHVTFRTMFTGCYWDWDMFFFCWVAILWDVFFRTCFSNFSLCLFRSYTFGILCVKKKLWKNRK